MSFEALLAVSDERGIPYDRCCHVPAVHVTSCFKVMWRRCHRLHCTLLAWVPRQLISASAAAMTCYMLCLQARLGELGCCRAAQHPGPVPGLGWTPDHAAGVHPACFSQLHKAPLAGAALHCAPAMWHSMAVCYPTALGYVSAHLCTPTSYGI